MLKAYYMLEENEIVSQFDANYLGDYDLNALTNVIGVNHYKVKQSFFLFFFVIK